VGGDAGAGVVGGRHRRRHRGHVPGRRKVPGRAVDPVADQLHPAVAGGRLALHRGRQFGRLDLDPDVAQVPLDGGHVLAGAGEAGHVRVAVQLRVRVRRAGVTDRQHAPVAVDRGQRPGLVE
jgi:hypothetical protein